MSTTYKLDINADFADDELDSIPFFLNEIASQIQQGYLAGEGWNIERDEE